MKEEDKLPKAKPPLPPNSAKVSQCPTQTQVDTTPLQNLPRTTQDSVPSAAPQTMTRTTQSSKRRDPASSDGLHTPAKIRKTQLESDESQREKPALTRISEKKLEASVQRFLSTTPGKQSSKRSHSSNEPSNTAISFKVVKMEKLNLISDDSSTTEGVSTSVLTQGEGVEITASDVQSTINNSGTSRPASETSSAQSELPLEINIKHSALERSQSFPLRSQDAPPAFLPIGYFEHKKAAATPIEEQETSLAGQLDEQSINHLKNLTSVDERDIPNRDSLPMLEDTVEGLFGTITEGEETQPSSPTCSDSSDATDITILSNGIEIISADFSVSIETLSDYSMSSVPSGLDRDFEKLSRLPKSDPEQSSNESD